ncbi:MAG TPA: 1,3-beta-galactosyl-N-acetylhexosamine phosphorylase [Erysipelothrix sp.]
MNNKKIGRVTLPVETEFFEETQTLIKKWGADAIRDSDGTHMDDQLKDIEGVKVYSKYFVARGDNEFALSHMDEAQQIFLMSDYHTATGPSLTIPFMNGFLEEQIVPDYNHDPKKWWQVIDRTTEKEIDKDLWEVNTEDNTVTLSQITPFHEYTVNFLAYMIWDPTQMYNHITNDWQDKEHEVPFDARQPHSNQHMKTALEKWLKENPKTDVVRFTTFFYHFTLFFNDQRKEKFVDWFGYGSSVSPAAIEAFEKEYGYRLVAEDFITNGSYNSTFKMPSQKYLDFIDFQQRFVCQEAKELVALVHEYGKEAIMFLGDNWIGTEPYGKYFKEINLDGVVGSVGGGATLRLISDIPHVRYTEGRFLPYFFPDTFYEGNQPHIEAQENWVSARRALMRSPLSRIGYGGYPSLAYQFPQFIDFVEIVTDEFREIISKIEHQEPYARYTVAIMNAWGSLRSWQSYMVAHALHYKQIYSYFGILEALSGLDVNVKFISFEDVKSGIADDIDVIINAGDAHTAFSGGAIWDDEAFVSAMRSWVHKGHGFIGVGAPSAYHKGGRFFQMADVLGVDQELGFTLSTDKYFNAPLEKHFITADLIAPFDYGEQVNNVYALSDKTEIIAMDNENVTLSAHEYGAGRGIYMMGLPYSMENTRVLRRAITYALKDEANFKQAICSNVYCEVNLYRDKGHVALINNSMAIQETLVYDLQGKSQTLRLDVGEIKWGVINEADGSFNF